ncbi:MAG TPA: DUF1841 family protein [Steroidobacteraceae bacterium]|nr:DUF1841 family protein [Steroidobacteraceae bacterium]
MSLFSGQDRDAMRNAWRTAWGRHLGRLPLAPLQAQMTEVIALHPEYHAQLIESPGPAPQVPEDAEIAGRAFLHLGLHLALREQLTTDRPKGIALVHRRLSAAHRESHEAEHRMMDVLERTLREAQSSGRPPDEAQYFEALRRL